MPRVSMYILFPLLLWTAAVPTQAATVPPANPAYPAAARDAVVNDYFGTRVPAPYQWMEDLNSPAVAQWVAAENALTFSYLERNPDRDWVRHRLTQLWNYAKVSVPQVEAGKLFFDKNSGLQNQALVYEQDAQIGRAHV